MFELDDQKNDIIYYTLMIVFSIATICVLIYLIFGVYYVANLALAVYAICFSIIALFSIRKLIIIQNYCQRLNNLENKEFVSDEQKSEYEADKIKTKKLINKVRAREIVKSVLSSILAVFTIVVLVLF